MENKIGVKWKYTTGDSVNHVSISDDNRIIVLGAGDDVYCLDNSGNLIWKYATANYISAIRASANGANTFFVSENLLYCLDGTGKLLWRVLIGSSSDILSYSETGKTIIVGARDGNIYAFSLQGKMLWKYTIAGYATAMGIVEQKEVIAIGTSKGELYGLNMKGEVAWKQTGLGHVSGIHAVKDGSAILVATRNGEFRSYASQGTLKWSVPAGDWANCISASKDGSIVAGCSRNGQLYLISSDGKPVSKHNLGGNVLSCVVSADGKRVIAATDSNIVYSMEPRGQNPWQYTTQDWINSIVADTEAGAVYIGSSDSTIYGIDNVEDKAPPVQQQPRPAQAPEKPKEEPKKPVDAQKTIPKPAAKKPLKPLPPKREEEIIETIFNYVTKERHMIMKRSEVANLYFSLKTQPFVILNGRPGLGKTKLAIDFVSAFRNKIYDADSVVEVFIPVHHEYDETDMLGYVNLADEYIPSQFAKALFLNADGTLRDPQELLADERLYFILLDEMNLSQPDYYMTKILAAVESGKPVSLPARKGESRGALLPLPKNTFIIGTINSYMEESTRTRLSGGVKRRANIIFVSNPLDDIFRDPDEEKQIQVFSRYMETIVRQISDTNRGDSLMGKFRSGNIQDVKNEKRQSVFRRLFAVTKVLHQYDATKLTIGILQDILEYMLFSTELSETESMDYQLLQKVAPHISGDAKLLEELLAISNFETDYPSMTKLLRKMQKDAVENMNIIVSQV